MAVNTAVWRQWTHLNHRSEVSTEAPKDFKCSIKAEHRGCACFYLRQPVVLRSNMDDWNLTLGSSRWETLLQPECGMTTVLVSVVSASRMMVIFTASHEDRFQRTPEMSRIGSICVALNDQNWPQHHKVAYKIIC